MDLATADSASSSAGDHPPREGDAPSEATLLGSYDVFSLIVNKMIGTGIYTTPSSVFLLTGSKQLSLGLWAVGFLYTIMSMFIYLDYAVVFPYTGGELVYINEITISQSPNQQDAMPSNSERMSEAHADDATQRRTQEPHRVWVFFGRVFGDGLLAYVIYAFFLTGAFNSATNSMQIGREILIGINPSQNPDRDLLRFIGIVAFSAICLIQLFSSRAGRILNGAFAFIKILFLIILLGFGIAAIRSNASPANFTQKVSGIPALNYAQALLDVMFSYGGWENANFVAGEISTNNPGILRKGFVWAVAVVGVLYMSLNAVFLVAIPYTDLVQFRNAGLQFNYAAMFSNNQPSAQRAWAIIIAISAAGNVNTVVYTFTRVKQAIGHANILPWSSLWKMDFSPHAHRNGDRNKTPAGGLILEWLGLVILVSASAVVPGTLESVQLPGNIQTYTHCFILVILGLGLFRLRKREEDLDITIKPSLFPRISRAHWLWKTCFVSTYVSTNLFILIINAMSNSSGVDNPQAIFQGRYFPTIVLSMLGLGILYYWTVFAAYVPNPFWSWSILHWANVGCRITQKPKYDIENEETRRFGLRRSIYLELNSDSPYWQKFLFWLFGGKIDPSPPELVEENWRKLYRKYTMRIASMLAHSATAGANSEGPQIDSVEGVELPER